MHGGGSRVAAATPPPSTAGLPLCLDACLMPAGAYHPPSPEADAEGLRAQCGPEPVLPAPHEDEAGKCAAKGISRAELQRPQVALPLEVGDLCRGPARAVQR